MFFVFIIIIFFSLFCFFQGQEVTGADSSPSPPPQKKSVMEELFGDTLLSQEERGQKSSLSFTDTIREEVASYRAADGIAVGGDPLAWWKVNDKKFPHIAMMARCYLAVPATSVPSERVFSTAGDIVTAKRSCLNPENVDILIFLKKNMSF